MLHLAHRTVSVSLIFFAIFITHSLAATRYPAKGKKRTLVEKRGAKNTRAEKLKAAARHRAEAARRAALVRQRAAEEAMRERVQSLIAKDDPTGEDPEIRRIAVNALGNHAGTVVVMNPKTGRVYSIVNQQWALREGFKPCSTIKLVTGLAGLNEKVINPSNTVAISDSNKVDLTRALAHSKNEYFQTVGGQVGFSKMISYAHLLGLGEKTGINVRSESPGRVPKSKTGSAVNHMSSHGDDFKVTALQLATLISTIGNGGKLLSPFVARTSQEERRSTPKVRRIVDIDSESFQRMIPGMIGSVRYGSGRLAFDPLAIVVGKTGTCIENGTWVGLFTSYAPLNDPQLAIAVIARGSDGRHHFPAAVAGRIYRELNSRMTASGAIDIAAKQTPAVVEADVTQADVDEEEEEAANDQPEATSASTTTATQPARPLWRDQHARIETKVKPTVLAMPKRTVSPNKALATQSLKRAGEKRQ